jgi:hypothetical protein
MFICALTFILKIEVALANNLDWNPSNHMNYAIFDLFNWGNPSYAPSYLCKYKLRCHMDFHFRYE